MPYNVPTADIVELLFTMSISLIAPIVILTSMYYFIAEYQKYLLHFIGTGNEFIEISDSTPEHSYSEVVKTINHLIDTGQVAGSASFYESKIAFTKGKEGSKKFNRSIGLSFTSIQNILTLPELHKFNIEHNYNTLIILTLEHRNTATTFDDYESGLTHVSAWEKVGRKHVEYSYNIPTNYSFTCEQTKKAVMEGIDSGKRVGGINLGRLKNPNEVYERIPSENILLTNNYMVYVDIDEYVANVGTISGWWDDGGRANTVLPLIAYVYEKAFQKIEKVHFITPMKRYG